MNNLVRITILQFMTAYNDKNTDEMNGLYDVIVDMPKDSHVEMVDLEAAEIDINQPLTILLHEAIARSDAHAIVTFLALGAQVDAPNEVGRTPLVAAIIGYARTKDDSARDCIQCLLQCGADVNLNSPQCAFPLFYAVGLGLDEIVGDLLCFEASVTTPHLATGDTPLFVAACYNQVNIMSLLLKAGANTEQLNHEGSTPLHVAVNNGYDAAVKELLKHGAKINVLNNAFCTPVHYAKTLSHPLIYSTLTLVMSLRSYMAQRKEKGDQLKLKREKVLWMTVFRTCVVKVHDLLSSAQMLINVILGAQPASALTAHLGTINGEPRLKQLYLDYLQYQEVVDHADRSQICTNPK